MKKYLWFTVIALLSLCSVRPLAAQKVDIAGNINGIELCPQFVCGAALFTGVYVGEVDQQPAFGTWFAAVRHDEELPEELGATANINGGAWQLNAWVRSGFFFARRQYNGLFTDEGKLTLVEPELFKVEAPMVIHTGGSGAMLLNLDLDESTFPQGVVGTLAPVPLALP